MPFKCEMWFDRARVAHLIRYMYLLLMDDDRYICISFSGTEWKNGSFSKNVSVAFNGNVCVCAVCEFWCVGRSQTGLNKNYIYSSKKPHAVVYWTVVLPYIDALSAPLIWRSAFVIVDVAFRKRLTNCAYVDEASSNRNSIHLPNNFWCLRNGSAIDLWLLPIFCSCMFWWGGNSDDDGDNNNNSSNNIHHTIKSTIR